MATQNVVQELKAERVQQELMLAEPFQISLKAERVQESLVPAGAGGTVSSTYVLSFNQMRAVKVELNEPRIVITLVATGGPEAA